VRRLPLLPVNSPLARYCWHSSLRLLQASTRNQVLLFFSPCFPFIASEKCVTRLLVGVQRASRSWPRLADDDGLLKHGYISAKQKARRVGGQGWGKASVGGRHSELECKAVSMQRGARTGAPSSWAFLIVV
jgi:hypothetical protein